VEVHVIDGLSGVGPLVDYEPVPTVRDAAFSGDPVGDLEHPPQEAIIVQVRDGLDVAKRKNQEVNWRLGVDVVKDGDVVVAIDSARPVAADQATEDAVCQTTSSN
jgi:hypothetical protein